MNKYTAIKIGIVAGIATVAIFSYVVPLGDVGGPGGPNLIQHILEGGGRADISHRVLDGAVGGWGN